MIRLSEHFTLEEFVRSRKAQARGIKNEPPAEAVEGLKLLVQHILEPLRQAWGQPIFITSGYRSPALNRAVGGAHNSQHCLGQAADIVADLSLLNATSSMWQDGRSTAAGGFMSAMGRATEGKSSITN